MLSRCEQLTVTVEEPSVRASAGFAASPTTCSARNKLRLHFFATTPLVPAMKLRELAGVPRLVKPGDTQIPVGTYLKGHSAQVMAEVFGRGPAPEPVTVVDAVDQQPGLEHQRVRDHRVVCRVGVLRDVEVLLDGALRVGEECPLGADRRAEFLKRVVIVGRDRGDLGVGDGDLGIERGEL
jgi:hypothetical protein